MRATGTGGREPGRRKGGRPGKAEPPSLKAEGPDSVSSDSQRDLTSGRLQVDSSAGEREGELLSPGRQSSAWRGTEALASAVSLAHPPAEIPKGTGSGMELAGTHKYPALCFCGSIPPTGLPPSRCRRAPPAGDQRPKPAPPAPVHLVDPP